MSRIRRNQHWRWLPIATVLAVLSVGCGGDPEGGRVSDAGAVGSGGAAGTAGGTGGTEFNGDAGAGGQEGTPPFFDASPESIQNNPVEQLLAEPQRNPFDFLATDAQGPQDYLEAAVACYAEPTACDSPNCTAFASCCTATGSCCKPVLDDPLPESIDFESCAGMTLDSCTSNADVPTDVFGPEQPVLTARGLVPNGTPTAEGGALVGEVLNLSSQRVVLEAQFSLPIGCNGVCVQSAGVAFTPYSDSNEFRGAGVGLLLSGSREVVNLMIGGQVADSFDAGNDATLWSLIVSPGGTVEVQRDGATAGPYLFDAASLAEARLAVFGRNLGADSNSAAVARIGAQTQFCDSPTGWAERGPLVVTVQGNVDPKLMMGREPSIAAGSQYTAVGFEVDGQIFVGQQEGNAQVSFDTPGPEPTVFPTEAFEAGGVGDPELFWLQDLLYVFYTAYDANGVGRIGSAVVTGNMPQKGIDPVLVPEGEVVSFDSPTISLRDDLIVMIVRATLQSGATELRAYYSVDLDTGWARIVDGTLEELTHVDDPASEINSPSLIVHNSAYHLYYARRTGTRWAVELAVSDELLLWRPLGEVLGASGEGFDSQGARGPDARSLTDGIELVYMGQDGISFQLGYAARPAPSDTAPTVF